MNDVPDGEITEETTAGSAPENLPDRMSVEEIAAFLSRTTRTVDRLFAAGRLVNLSGPGKRKRAARDQVAKVRAEMQAELSAIVKTPQYPLSEENAEKQIKADAFVSIMASAQAHAEEFFKLASVSMRDVNGDLRKLVTEMQTFHGKEYKRLTERISKLEDERAQYLEHLDRLQSEASQEADRTANRELIRETFKEAKVIAKAVIAMKLRGDAKASTQNSALDDWLNTIKPEQLDVITKTLTQEQFAGLMAIIQSAQQPAAETPNESK
jgi:hypothetical protein